LSTNILRTIDQRNAMYGQYKYQVQNKNIKEEAWLVREWCKQAFGAERDWVISNEECFQDYNPKWRMRWRTQRSKPVIYLATDAEATLFNLRWAGA